MKKEIGIGVIGLGYWGPNLVRNLAACEGASVRAVCDLTPGRVDFITRRFPSARGCADFRELIDAPDIDAVAVATPLSTHYAVAREALRKGKHVLVEKPMAGSVREAESLVALARERGVVLMTDHTFVYTGAVEKIREIIEKGDLGELYYFDSVRLNLGLFQKDINVVSDLGPHDFSILDYLIRKDPVAVSATGASHVRRGQENIAYLTVHYRDSFLAHVHVSWLAPAKVRTIILCGSERMVVYDDMQGSEKVKVYEKGVALTPSTETKYQTLVSYRMGDMWAPKTDDTEALGKVAADFVRCIRSGGRTRSDGEAGLRVVRLLEAANASLRKGGAKVRVKG